MKCTRAVVCTDLFNEHFSFNKTCGTRSA